MSQDKVSGPLDRTDFKAQPRLLAFFFCMV